MKFQVSKEDLGPVCACRAMSLSPDVQFGNSFWNFRLDFVSIPGLGIQLHRHFFNCFGFGLSGLSILMLRANVNQYRNPTDFHTGMLLLDSINNE